jgi:membrane protein DedA with SNARE-associated domain
MFGTTVFLSQYMQVARGYSPTASGLLTIPMVVGLFAASTTIGRIVSNTGYYKRWMILGSKVASSTAAGLAERGIQGGGAPSGSTIPDVGSLPGPVREVVEHAYGTGVAEIFLIAAPLGIVAFIAVWFLREKALGTKSGIELAAEQAQDAAADDEPRRTAPELREPVLH